jgi:hypothetical protein
MLTKKLIAFALITPDPNCLLILVVIAVHRLVPLLRFPDGVKEGFLD